MKIFELAKNFYNSRFVKFGIVGAVGVAFNTSFLMFFHERVGLELIVSSLLAIEGAILINFFWNENWTFYGVPIFESVWTRLCKYHLISIGGAAINVSILYILTAGGLWYAEANIAGIFVGFLWNYFANANYTWKT
jgi:dolichol-phosphate mannosyltransferase